MRPSKLALLSFLTGLLLLPLVVVLYLAFGHPPVATTDKPFPLEGQIVSIPLEARIRREMPTAAPIPATDENLNAGASLYKDKCEFCHGTADQPSAVGRSTFPRAPQLWIKRTNGSVGATYWKIKNGIRLTAMPAYGSSLTETQLWQVSLLLSLADKPLPAEAARTVGR